MVQHAEATYLMAVMRDQRHAGIKAEMGRVCSGSHRCAAHVLQRIRNNKEFLIAIRKKLTKRFFFVDRFRLDPFFKLEKISMLLFHADDRRRSMTDQRGKIHDLLQFLFFIDIAR
jgi:hypothetical protein